MGTSSESKNGSGEPIRRVAGRGLPLRGDSIDTDRIMPARYLRCVTFAGLEDRVFEDDRSAAGPERHPFDRECYRGASILVVNANFGCGSSREHAPQGLMRWGIRALVGVSFAEIFFGNCVALGIPCVTLPAADVEKLQSFLEQSADAQVSVDLEAKAVTYREPADRELPATAGAFPAEIPEGAREAFLNGTWDATGTLLARPQDIRDVASRLPYVSGFAG